VSSDEQQQHVALPTLFGAPAYARPPSAAPQTERPPDVDDLPLSAFQTPEERALAESLPARPYRGVEATPGAGYIPGRNGTGPRLEGRPFRLRAFAERLLGADRAR
jgi:hypothetical protein